MKGERNLVAKWLHAVRGASQQVKQTIHLQEKMFTRNIHLMDGHWDLLCTWIYIKQNSVYRYNTLMCIHSHTHIYKYILYISFIKIFIPTFLQSYCRHRCKKESTIFFSPLPGYQPGFLRSRCPRFSVSFSISFKCDQTNQQSIRWISFSKMKKIQ